MPIQRLRRSISFSRMLRTRALALDVINELSIAKIRTDTAAAIFNRHGFDYAPLAERTVDVVPK